jgi:hypothetical protein
MQHIKQRIGCTENAESPACQPSPSILPAGMDASSADRDPLFKTKYKQQAYAGSVVALRQTVERHKLEKELQNQKSIGLYSKHLHPEYAARMEQLYDSQMRHKLAWLHQKAGHQHDGLVHKAEPVPLMPSLTTATNQIHEFWSGLHGWGKYLLLACL